MDEEGWPSVSRSWLCSLMLRGQRRSLRPIGFLPPATPPCFPFPARPPSQLHDCCSSCTLIGGKDLPERPCANTHVSPTSRSAPKPPPPQRRKRRRRRRRRRQRRPQRYKKETTVYVVSQTNVWRAAEAAMTDHPSSALRTPTGGMSARFIF